MLLFQGMTEGKVMLLVFNPCLPLWSQGFHVREGETMSCSREGQRLAWTGDKLSTSDISVLNWISQRIRSSKRFQGRLHQGTDPEASCSLLLIPDPDPFFGRFSRLYPYFDPGCITPLLRSSEASSTTVKTWGIEHINTYIFAQIYSFSSSSLNWLQRKVIL
jgi:hypothetical protein